MALITNQWVNPCGGKRWRNHVDGRIEVEGEGFPDWPDTAPQAKYLRQTWTNWAPQFRAAAKAYPNVPIQWLLAIATQESGLWSGPPVGVPGGETQRTIGSKDGFSSIGIMQPIPGTATMLGFKPDDRYDAGLNILMGAKLMSQNAAKESGSAGLPALAALYNSGRLCLAGRDEFGLRVHTGSNYAMQAIRWNNQAIRLGVGKSTTGGVGLALPVLAFGVAAVGVVVALPAMARAAR